MLSIAALHSSFLLNLLVSSLVEVGVILCWHSSWGMVDTLLGEADLLCLLVGLAAGLAALLVQLPILYLAAGVGQQAQHILLLSLGHALLSALGLLSTGR